MAKKSKDWKVIYSHFDLNERVKTNNGRSEEPKAIGVEVFEYDDKNEAVKKYAQSFKEFEKKSYDWKGHSMAALKFYYEEDGKEILTYVLLHHKNEEFVELTGEELDSAMKD